MVQIATAEQGEFEKTYAGDIPLIEEGTIDREIVIEKLRAGALFFRTALELDDDPSKGWKLEEGEVESEQIESLVGMSPESVEIIGPIIRVKINEFAQENIQFPKRIAEYTGMIADLGWLETA